MIGNVEGFVGLFIYNAIKVKQGQEWGWGLYKNDRELIQSNQLAWMMDFNLV